MNTQQILTILIIGITTLYGCLMIIDLIGGLVYLWHQITLNLPSPTIETTSAQSESGDTDKHIKIEHENLDQKPNYLSSESKPEPQNFVSIDIDKIDLRTARKIASALKKALKPNSDLIIKQKVNGKSVSLAWLQAQIKHRLELAPEMITPIIREFAATATVSEQ
ncbi:hypothetical protein NIES4074_64250 (plasmid) [Cylindrospermum sp. NIES-4074]|nr:hypothetical protein NIES4074_64250 [Cylindrospermum sp. NIES-4074]